ncbi:MAG: MATE family efflux transporter, partial [Lachnospiraceae bacterium]|nr:MATE family efflux transporter [Lachnospiraceae bacterium]
FTNIFFNWMFIFGKLGAPRMEIAGAALGTTIARTFEFLIIAGYFFFIDKRIGYRIKDFFMRVKGLVKEYIKVSFPVLVSDTLLTFGNNAIAIVMGHIGSTFVAANSVSTVVVQLVTIFGQAVANSSGIITGQTLGRGDVEKAKFDAYTFVIIGIIIGLFAGTITFAIRGPVINYYNISAEAKAIANQMLIAISILTVFQIMNSILTKGVLRSGGDTRFLMVGDILFLWVLSIPLGALSGLVWHWPAFWVFFMLKIDQIVKCIWCLFRLKSGKWVKYIRQSDDVAAKQKSWNE